MTKGALYWRLKDEKTGKWTYKRAEQCEDCYAPVQFKWEQCELCKGEE